ncbi:MAG: hypothetical protein L6R48_04595 [Planctomycetes bacterium]|nr:hypothetical protein [Planctomycetota bacterium]
MAELPTPEELAVDRPQVRHLEPGPAGCLRTITAFALTAWLPAQAVWPLLAPPAGPAAELLPVLAGALVALAMFTRNAGFTPSTTYVQVAEVPATSTLPLQWWRALLVLAWAPALVLLLAQRVPALLAGAPALGGWWAALGGLVAGLGTLMALAALCERHAVFLHPAGIHAGPLYFHPWKRVVGVRSAGRFVVLDLDRRRSHPPVVLALEPKALAQVLDEARRRGVSVSEELPGMWPGKLVALATAAAATWGAWRLAAAGLPWPAAALAVAGACVGITLLQERLTGAHGLMRNRLVLQPAPAAAAPMDAEAFTVRWCDELRRRQPGVAIERLGTLRLRSHPAGSEDWCEHRLDNAFACYQREPARLDTILARFLDTAAEISSLGAVEAERLLPAIRHRDLLAELPADAQPLHRVLAGDLLVLLAEDLPSSVRYVGRADLAALGLDEAAAWQRAFANLPRLVPERQVDGRDGFYLLRAPWHAGAALLDPAFFTSMRFPVQGCWLVGLPNRDLCLVSGDGEPAALARLRTAVGAEHGGPGSVSSQVFRIARDGTWSVVEG